LNYNGFSAAKRHSAIGGYVIQAERRGHRVFQPYRWLL